VEEPNFIQLASKSGLSAHLIPQLVSKLCERARVDMDVSCIPVRDVSLAAKPDTGQKLGNFTVFSMVKTRILPTSCQ
jgi:hypothetical protein